MTTRKGRFIFCIQIIVVLTKYTAGFQNETTDDYITTTNSNDEFVWESMNLDEIQNFRYYGFNLLRRSQSVRFDEEAIDECKAGYLLNEEFEDQCIRFIFIYESVARYLINEEFEHPYSLLTYEFVWESMNLDEIQNFRYYGFKRPRRSRSVRFDEEAINESEAIHLLNEEFEDPYSWFISINESEAIHLLNEEFEDLNSQLICTEIKFLNLVAINESEAGHLINEEFEDPYNWFIYTKIEFLNLVAINESEAGHLINEEFEDPYNWFIYCNYRYDCKDINLLEAYLSERKVSGFEDVSRKTWFDIIYESEAGCFIYEEFEHPYSWLTFIYESEAGYLINEKFEHPYSWLTYCNHRVHWKDIYLLEEYLSERKVSGFEDVSRKTWFDNCSPEIYEPKMLEYKVAFTTRFIEDGPLSWIQLEICGTKELNYQTSMESLHGIESTALLATFILTVLSMRIVSEEQLIKDTVSHSLIVKTTTKEARQNLPTKAEEEAVRHCELCINHDQAIAYCMTCKLYICMPCNGLHKRVWTLMNHTVCPFNHM